MQAANYDLVIAEIPIEFRKRKGGESRLISNQTIVLGLLADMLRTHRRIQDEILYGLKKVERDNKRK